MEFEPVAVSVNRESEDDMKDDLEIELSTESYNIEAMQELKKALKTTLENKASPKNVIISKQDEGIRITPQALVGKDTDWIITREILPLCLPKLMLMHGFSSKIVDTLGHNPFK